VVSCRLVSNVVGGGMRLTASRPLEAEALLARSAPYLLDQPIVEQMRSPQKTVWAIGDTHVLRRANADWVRSLMVREHLLLHHLSGRTTLSIPESVFVAPDGEFDLLVKARGEPIEYSWWPRLEPEYQLDIAKQFGRFLAELHGALEFGQAIAMGFERGASPPSPEWVKERLVGQLSSPKRESLLKELLRIAPRLYEEALPPALLHDDFSHHNAGFSPDGHRVLGVFDFTQARLGDPHRDLRYAFTFEPFAESMIKEYESVRGLELDRNLLRAWHAWSALGTLAWEFHHGDPGRLPLRWGWVDHVAEWDRSYLDSL